MENDTKNQSLNSAQLNSVSGGELQTIQQGDKWLVVKVMGQTNSEQEAKGFASGYNAGKEKRNFHHPGFGHPRHPGHYQHNNTADFKPKFPGG